MSEREPLMMLLRLDQVGTDEVGWWGRFSRRERGRWATFVGKPDMHGNRLTVPISAEQADRLRPGEQYLFVHAPELDWTTEQVRGQGEVWMVVDASVQTVALFTTRERAEQYAEKYSRYAGQLGVVGPELLNPEDEQ